jgi:hypothetical protein
LFFGFQLGVWLGFDRIFAQRFRGRLYFERRRLCFGWGWFDFGGADRCGTDCCWRRLYRGFPRHRLGWLGRLFVRAPMMTMV